MGPRASRQPLRTTVSDADVGQWTSGRQEPREVLPSAGCGAREASEAGHRPGHLQGGAHREEGPAFKEVFLPIGMGKGLGDSQGP